MQKILIPAIFFAIATVCLVDISPTYASKADCESGCAEQWPHNRANYDACVNECLSGFF